jgi:hypothetical protein
MFHALATEGNASKYFVARIGARDERNDKSRRCTFYDVLYTRFIHGRSVNEDINSARHRTTSVVLDAEPDRRETVASRKVGESHL